jgi:hypothetical protein
LCLGFLVSGLAQGSNNLGLSVWPCFVFSWFFSSILIKNINFNFNSNYI